MDKQLAVLGSPIEHSKSPAIHQAAYDVLGLPWRYGKFEIRKGGLRNFLDGLDASWLGLSLTMPLKEEAARMSTSLDAVAQQTNAANTLLRVGNDWHGFNTDVFGIEQAVRLSSAKPPKRVLIIGSGATATSAMVAIAHLAPKSKVLVFARNTQAKTGLVTFGNNLGLQASGTGRLTRACRISDLTISTLPANALDEFAAKLRRSKFFSPRGTLLDVVYKNWPTDLASIWVAKRRPAISGLEMLLWQAVAQIRIFSGGDPAIQLENEVEVVEAMRQAVGD